jgi:hypothetical protein
MGEHIISHVAIKVELKKEKKFIPYSCGPWMSTFPNLQL